MMVCHCRNTVFSEFTVLPRQLLDVDLEDTVKSPATMAPMLKPVYERLSDNASSNTCFL